MCILVFFNVSQCKSGIWAQPTQEVEITSYWSRVDVSVTSFWLCVPAGIWNGLIYLTSLLMSGNMLYSQKRINHCRVVKAHGVTGSGPAGGEILSEHNGRLEKMSRRCTDVACLLGHFTKPFIITFPSSWYYWNMVEKAVKIKSQPTITTFVLINIIVI